MSQRILIAAAALGALAATPAAARETAVFAKPGVGRTELQAHGGQCWEEARGIRPPSVPYSTYGGSVAGAAAGGLAVGIMQGIAQAKAQQKYVDTCMRLQGFGKLELTAQEDAALDAAKSQDARNAWYDGFLAQDLKARVDAALVPVAAPMTPAAAEPYVVGGIRLDPAKLTVAPGPVAAKQPLLTGPATHRRTARLKQDFRITGTLDMRAEAGAVFHQVSYAPSPKGGLTGDTQWCGPVRNNSIRGRISQPNCVSAGFDGYQVTVDWGAKDWLKGDGARAIQPTLVKGSTLALEESDTDLLGPMDLSLNLARLTKGGAMLEAVALHDGQKVKVWSGFVKLENGQGELPFWDRRLKLTRSGDTVTAELAPGGDGRGWLDPEPAKTAD